MEVHTSPQLIEHIEKLTAELEALKAKYYQVIFTAEDYWNQGNALFGEERYEEAISSYATKGLNSSWMTLLYGSTRLACTYGR